MADTAYIIGIDFGTTYSGVAWCWAGQPENIQLVTRWKSRQNLTHDVSKTPTEIHYSPGSDVPTWGYDVPTEEEPIRWFKLLLADDEDLSADLKSSSQLRRARELVQATGKTPVQVIADYLKLLWAHALDDIARDRGESALKGSPLIVWITVPAIWSKKACGRMREAAKLAGILAHRTAGKTILELVAEPEAAAMAVLDDLQGRPDIKEGDALVVCDAGGGTVDIISYVIDNTSPIMVRECVEGRGKMCGAIFVDAAFANMLRLALGDKWKRMSLTSRKSLMNNEWEWGIKRLFDDTDQEWSVSVPAEAFQHKGFKFKRTFDGGSSEVPMKSGQLKFDRGQIRQFFGTVFPDIRGLIHDQVTAVKEKCKGKAPKAILLVGGLGSCNYLYLVLKKEFQPQGIDVLQPNGARPWTAICRGAVIRGLSDADIKSRRKALIVSRVSRHSYGLSTNEDFDPSEHNEEDKTWCKRELCYKATNQMSWYIQRGDDVYSKRPVELDFYRLLSQPPERSSLKFETAIYHNDDATAPKRRISSVAQLVTIAVQIDTPYDELPTFTNANDQVFRRISYKIQMTSTGVEMQWKVLVNGRVQGEKNVRYISDVAPSSDDAQYLKK